MARAAAAASDTGHEAAGKAARDGNKNARRDCCRERGRLGSAFPTGFQGGWRMRVVRWLLAAAVMAWAGGSAAAELAQPAGQVVLTVAGDVGASNRGPYDDFEDGFFKHHERKFDKAATFDLAMLEGLGMHAVDVSYSGWPRPAHFEGPWLKDVLAAAGASGKDISVLALDGFASEIGAADIGAYDWIVAVK